MRGIRAMLDACVQQRAAGQRLQRELLLRFLRRFLRLAIGATIYRGNYTFERASGFGREVPV